MPDQQIGPYTIQQLIGGGGMADVYLAWDQANRWPVAVKVLRAAPGKDAKLLRRSEREAALLMELRHPHIVQVYAAGQAADGRYYIAMEYVAGGDLDDLMRHKPGNKLPVVEAVYLMRRVAGAVAYAHEAGIVHRDLKPGNVLIRADNGEPVVTDLGIAAFAGANPLTGTMESLGTPQYMAPEQISGDRPADGRADVYAIGVMLYELLTGRLPFTGENNWAILLRKQQEAAPPVLTARRDLPPSLAAVIDACLQRDPAARYQTAGALATALDAFLPPDARPPAPVPIRRRGTITPHTPSNPPATPPATGGARSRRRVPVLWAGGAALALVLLLALLIPAFGRGARGGATAMPGESVAHVTGAVEATAETTKSAAAEPAQPTSTLAGLIVDTPVAATLAGLTDPSRATSTHTRVPTRPASATRSSVTATTVRAVRDVYTRSGPGMAYPTAGGLGRDEIVTVLAQNTRGDWYQVASDDGTVWVYRTYVTANSGSLTSVPIAEAIPAPPTNTPTSTPTNATPSTLPEIGLVQPRPAACPPDPNAPAYSANDTINFQWTWSGVIPDGGYLEVRAGVVGSMVSQGRADPTLYQEGDQWRYPVSAQVIFRAGDGAYQWAVYLISGDGRPLLNSPVSCFGLVESAVVGNTPIPLPDTPTPTEPPPPADSDDDGVPDSEDECPFENTGLYPDPNRPGCPLPYPSYP